MYTLRILEESKIISNHYLGNAYSHIQHGSKMFDDIMEREYPSFDKKKVDSLIVGITGETFFILNNLSKEGSQYFIMNGSGQTFERL